MLAFLYIIYVIYIIYELLQRARLVEHNILGKMKSQFFIGILLWVSCHCIHQAYYLLYIFCLPKISKNRNINVCSRIPLSRETSYIENSQSICSANQSFWFLHGRRKKEFLGKLQHTYQVQNTILLVHGIIYLYIT